jgi:hypothetical protein
MGWWLSQSNQILTDNLSEDVAVGSIYTVPLRPNWRLRGKHSSARDKLCIHHPRLLGIGF